MNSNRIPFISGPYYKESLRELKVLGIIAAAVQLLYGLSASFGNSGSAIATLVIGTAASAVKTVFQLYFFIAAIIFVRSHISRNSWDFRGSIPIAKRTMFASFTAAVLTFAVIIFAANYAGALIGELIRLIPGCEAGGIPAGYGMSAVTLLTALLAGLCLYSGIVIIGSLVTKPFGVIIAVAAVLFLPSLYLSFAGMLKETNMSFGELFFPFPSGTKSVLVPALAALFAAVVTVLAYFAYANAQAETFNKPARAKWVHITLGLLLASVVGLLILVIVTAALWFVREMQYPDSGPIMREPDFISAMIAAAVIMVVVYVGYMWAGLKSFKKACGRLVYLPIALAFIASALLLAKGADAIQKKLDFSAENIKYVTVNDAVFANSESRAYIYDGIIPVDQSRGSSGAQLVRLTDPDLIALVSDTAEKLKDDAWDGRLITQVVTRLMLGNEVGSIEFTLKDGRTFALPPEITWMSALTREHAFANEEYRARATDVSRFKNGFVFRPAGLDKEFARTLIEEIESLPPEDRIDIFTDPDQTSFETEMLYTGPSDSLAKVLLVSPTYDHSVVLNLTSKLPRSRALYMKQLTDSAKKNPACQQLLSRLASSNYDYLYGEIILVKNGSSKVSEFQFFPNDADMEPAYNEHARKMSALIGESFEKDMPIDSSDYVLGLRIRSAGSEDVFDGMDAFSVFFGGMDSQGFTIFTGIDEATYIELENGFFPVDGTGIGDDWTIEPDPFAGENGTGEWM